MFIKLLRLLLIGLVLFASPNNSLADDSLYSMWNGFIDIINIFEISNPALEPQDVSIKIMQSNGTLGEELLLTLRGGEQRDIILNDLGGFKKNSYGLLIVSASSQEIAGRVSYYKHEPDGHHFAFVFSSPLRKTLTKESFTIFNSFYPLGENQAKLTANWLTIVNMEDDVRTFELIKRDSLGLEVGKNHTLHLRPFERFDYEAGHVNPGPSSVGNILIKPKTSETKYLAQLMRYGIDETARYRFAFAIEPTSPSDGPLYAPIRRLTVQGGDTITNWLEVLNASPLESQITIIFRNDRGKVLLTETRKLAAFSQYHWYASGILGEDYFGTAEINSNVESSLIVQSMYYLLRRDETDVNDIYGSRGFESYAAQRNHTLSWNSFLNTENLLTIVNPTIELQNAELKVFSIDGEAQTNYVQVPPFGLTVIPIAPPKFATLRNSYGSLSISKGLLAEVLRVSKVQGEELDFVNNTVPIESEVGDKHSTNDDQCPDDLTKTTPGICGCGFSDADSDLDKIADCKDECPLDPLKGVPGVCGCGVLDIDSDKDGIYDCKDLCPEDINKSSPGICGCGVADGDQDNDGYINCIDECPFDKSKSSVGTCGCGITDEDLNHNGIIDCKETFINNGSFEDGLTSWLYAKAVYEGGSASVEMVNGECFEGTYCARLSMNNGNWSALYQDITKLPGGRTFNLTAMLKGSVGQKISTRLFNRDWKDSNGKIVGKSYTTTAKVVSGSWFKVVNAVRTPQKDDFGESTTNHRWRVYLFASNGEPLYFDDISLRIDHAYLAPFGPFGGTVSRSIDFGSDNEATSGIIFNQEYWTSPAIEEETSYRSIIAGKKAVIDIPAFNVDSLGSPKSPMILEIGYKDVINQLLPPNTANISSHQAFVTSRLDYQTNDPAVIQRFVEPRIGALGRIGDGAWTYEQILIDSNRFPLMRAVNGRFRLGILMPSNYPSIDSITNLPIDYLSLTVVSEEVRDAFLEHEKVIHNFVKAGHPNDRLGDPSFYPDSNLAIFSRDLMHPIYSDTQPKNSELTNSLEGVSTPGESAILKIGLYSSQGITNLSFRTSELVNPTSGELISKDNIRLSHVVHRDRRLLPNGNTYGKTPDFLEPFKLLNIASDETQTIVIEIEVAPELTGGTFTGSLEVLRNGSLINTLELNLQVMPFKLINPTTLYSIYHDPFYKTYSSDIQQVFRFYRWLGVTPFYYLRDIKPLIAANGQISNFDLSTFVLQLSRLKAEELIPNGKMILEPFYWSVSQSICTAIFNVPCAETEPELWTKLSDPRFVNAFELLISKLIEAASKEEITLYFSLGDEPGLTPAKRIIVDRLATIVKRQGSKTLITYYTTCDQPITNVSSGAIPFQVPNNTIPPLTSLIDFKLWAMRYFGEGLRTQPENFGYYTTYYSQLPDPTYNRFLHGVSTFVTAPAIVTAYAMGDFLLSPFNDFDPTPGAIFPFNAPDYLLAYPTWDSGKLLPTVSALGIKEGIVDAKYIATLSVMIQRYPFFEASKKAAYYLQELKNSIKPDLEKDHLPTANTWGFAGSVIKNLSETGSEEDYLAFSKIRSKVSAYILAIRAASQSSD